MLFFVLIFFSSKYFSANSLVCMTHTSGGILASFVPCKISLDINEMIPNNTKFLQQPTTCEMQEPSVTIFGSILVSSCYAEISIDYQTKKMSVTLTHVNSGQALVSPYDDMFGFFTGIKSVIQYKINGNLEKEKVEMITRIQCDTADNCALDKLRKLLPNLTATDTRLTIFKEIVTLLNTPDEGQESTLTCMVHDDDEAKACSDDENKCKFERSKGVPSTKDCVAAVDNSGNHDIEYRFNVIDELASDGSDNSDHAFKLFYQCQRNLCNGDSFVRKVDDLLFSFVYPSAYQSGQNTNNGNSASQAHAQNKKNAKSIGVSFTTSFYYRSMIIFSLIIQFLSN